MNKLGKCKLVITDYKMLIFVTKFDFAEQRGSKFSRSKQWHQDHTGLRRCISSALSAYTTLRLW